MGKTGHRLGLSPILGYLVAGIAVGPYTPGFVADAQLAMQLAEVGVVLLMFGVGLHFHLHDLLAVKSVAIPGAVVQSAVATGLGVLLGLIVGWTWAEGLVLGLSISVASTVVLIRVLLAQGTLETPPGHVAVAPGGRHLRISSGLGVVLSPEPSEARHIPSIDVTMRSAARSRPGRVLGILLTGMGEDGADGMVTIRAGGGVTIAESESSCVVYGMPRAAVRRGGASLVLPLDDIAELLAALAG